MLASPLIVAMFKSGLSHVSFAMMVFADIAIFVIIDFLYEDEGRVMITRSTGFSVSLFSLVVVAIRIPMIHGNRIPSSTLSLGFISSPYGGSRSDDVLAGNIQKTEPEGDGKDSSNEGIDDGKVTEEPQETKSDKDETAQETENSDEQKKEETKVPEDGGDERPTDTTTTRDAPATDQKEEEEAEVKEGATAATGGEGEGKMIVKSSGGKVVKIEQGDAPLFMGSMLTLAISSVFVIFY